MHSFRVIHFTVSVEHSEVIGQCAVLAALDHAGCTAFSGLDSVVGSGVASDAGVASANESETTRP